MSLDRQRARQYIKAFDFASLFIEELGWDRYSSTIQLRIDDMDFNLTAFAEKRGLVAYVCLSSNGAIPVYSLRRKIEGQVAKSAFEHIIIYTDKAKTTQVWQWVRREPNKPAASREHTFNISQPGDALIQKLEAVVFSLEEEESLTTVAVAGRVRVAFDLERVTKRFYDRFKTEHAQFLKFIQGIPDEEMKRWYASVMINRLMFIYFIQKKGFLNNDRDYLRSKLQESKKRGKDLYYSGFLSPLFFRGFAQKTRSEGTQKLLGKVPYLNGGLFLKHQIEEQLGSAIEIRDSAFEKLFTFFDAYQWHLDERPLRRDNEINPDVLGYIFEKYINQKQMGAYYTKEDITEYISKNTIVPFLFERAREKCKIAFEGEHSVWHLLQDDPDRYIYKAVRHGVTWDIHGDKPLETPYDLPSEIAVGVNRAKPNLIERRKSWNKSAPSNFALPTELWREVVARRNRYQEIRAKLVAGEVRDVNDLITYNLDIRQFAQDVIENSEGPDLLNAFWHATEKVTVLDPACGSGAFLFAALNILEPLYEACLDRMDVFLEEWGEQGKGLHPNYYKLFSGIRKRLGQHPNRRYFILKSIIINNLFGVDIMEEATEICKLRLFLKLVAQVERDEQIEPLPDIDFNIRAGNTLVGYFSHEEVEKATSSKFDFENAMEKIEDKVLIVDAAMRSFRQQQTELGGEVTVDDKKELRKKLKVLEDELNAQLSSEYGVKSIRSAQYTSWLQSHKPFHWFIEFHALMKEGGFDVIIGNPPYVEWTKIKEYKPPASLYATLACGNIYTTICERSYRLLGPKGHFGMIVPISSVATERMDAFRKLWAEYKFLTHSSHYSGDAHPSVLFNGVKFRLSILLQQKGKSPEFFSTAFQRWYAQAREFLFPLISYSRGESAFVRHSLFPKITPQPHHSIMEVLCNEKKALNLFVKKNSPYEVYSHRIVAHFVKAMDFVPFFRSERDGTKRSEDYKVFAVETARAREALTAVLNSSLFYSWFVTYSDVYHCGRDIILDFPINLATLADSFGSDLEKLNQRLMNSLRQHAKRRKVPYEATGIVEYDEFYPRKSKLIIDEIDRVLRAHYGLDEEELDFIINYDIKYRMGLTGEREDSE
jgi:hypothetical protein